MYCSVETTASMRPAFAPVLEGLEMGAERTRNTVSRASAALAHALLLAAALAVAIPAGAQPSVKTGSKPAAAPQAGLDLNRLKELDNPALTPSARLQHGLRLYRDEMVRPTPRPKPLAPSPRTSQTPNAKRPTRKSQPLNTRTPEHPNTQPVKTHDYVLARITEKLAAVELDLPQLRRTWESANPGEVKDCLAILLLMKGQADQQEGVVAFVLDRAKPMRLRELAAKALGDRAAKEQDASLGPVLARVIREDAQGVYRR
jgi:hypothetical protein